MNGDAGGLRELGRVFGRMGWCVLLYVALHAAAWLAVSQTVGWGETFLGIMATGRDLFPFVGIPTLLIGVCAASVHQRMDPVRFRIVLGLSLVPWVWPLLASSSAEPLLFQVLAQLAFAALIPAPLFPERWAGAARGGGR
ncbi:hypothetical protein [Streptomyces sp. NPDC090025]|uniref:hypothetical protein n=1 Tax=Streptomyces sp. NPDC090025 TaxID=3365922 RepID=UPI003833C495